MKIKAAVGIAILCIGFLLFGMFVPISTETEEYLLQDLPEQYMDTKQEWEEMQSAFSLLNGWSRTTDTAYVSTTKTLFGNEIARLYAYHICAVRSQTLVRRENRVGVLCMAQFAPIKALNSVKEHRRFR